MNNYKLIISDVDGTLAESRQLIDKETAELIEGVMKTKIFCAMSGSDELLTRRRLLPLIRRQEYDEKKLLISATSGAGLFYIDDRKLCKIYKELLTDEEKEKIIRIVCNLEEKYNLRPVDKTHVILENRGSQFTLSCIGHNAPLDLKKKYDPDGKYRLKMLEWIKNNKKLDVTGLTIRIGGTTSIDFTREGMNKKYGVKKVLEFLNRQYPKISRDEVIFFGDKTEKTGNDYIENYVRTIQINSISQMKEYLRKIITGENF